MFGFHLAGIDIRQGAGVLREATAAILPGYGDADEPRRQALLTEALASRPARDRATTRAARRASCCACSTPWR